MRKLKEISLQHFETMSIRPRNPLLPVAAPSKLGDGHGPRTTSRATLLMPAGTLVPVEWDRRNQAITAQNVVVASEDAVTISTSACLPWPLMARRRIRTRTGCLW